MMQPTKHLYSAAVCGLFFALAGCHGGSPAISTSFGLDLQPNENAKRFGVLAQFSNTSCFGQPYAVYANNASERFQITGSTNKIQGDVHTNDTLKMAGNQNQITGTAEAAHGFDVSGNGSTMGARQATPVETFPVTYNAAAYTPTFTFQGDVDLRSVAAVWARPGVLKTGVYKATGKLSLSGNGATGQVTFIADSIQISGKDNQLIAAKDGLLFLATGTGNNTVHVSGNSNTLGGMIDAPRGEFQLTGSENAIQGMVMTDVAKIAGSRNSIVFQDFGFCRTAPTAAPQPSCSPSASPTVPPSTSPSVDPAPTPAVASPSQPPAPTPVPSTAPPTPPPASGTTWTFQGGGTPFAVAVDAANDIWTTNDGNYVTVSKNDNSGAMIDSRVVGSNAHDLAIEQGNQNVWVTVFSDSLIYAFKPDLAPTWGFQANGTTPVRYVMPTRVEGIAFDGNQTPYACGWDSGVIYKLDPVNGPNGANGGYSVWHDFHSSSAHPRDLIFDDAGNAYVTLNGANAVAKLDASGNEVGRVATDAHPSKLAFDQAGNVWVTCTGTDIDFLTAGEAPGHTVVKINPACNGTSLSFPVGNSPYGITCDPAGDLLVVNGGSYSMSRLNPTTGAVVQTYAAGSASSSHPTSVAMDHNGYAWISVFTDNLLLKLWP
ncbi:MAG: hypothetical protein JWM80_1891 [Cyanobacteria bacterium RYN_339]|nr:hypothetical protein [Cyanobacteria bacterium RYN_339]